MTAGRNCIQKVDLAPSKPKACQSISRWLSESASDTTGKPQNYGCTLKGCQRSAIPSGSERLVQQSGGVARGGLNHRLMNCHRSAMKSTSMDFEESSSYAC